jgi:hypothetical protein
MARGRSILHVIGHDCDVVLVPPAKVRRIGGHFVGSGPAVTESVASNDPSS